MVAYLIALLAALTVLWLGLSGHYTVLLLCLGGVSIGLCTLLALRLRILDREGAPYVALFGAVGYLPWLLWEIVKSNAMVVRACLRAELDIHPTLVKLKTECQSDLAKTVFANSITLTPGTVTMAIEGDKLLVHGLYEDAAQPEAFEEMDRRARRAIDGSKAST